MTKQEFIHAISMYPGSAEIVIDDMEHIDGLQIDSARYNKVSNTIIIGTLW